MKVSSLCQHVGPHVYSISQVKKQTLTWSTCREEEKRPIKYMVTLELHVSSCALWIFWGNLRVIAWSDKIHQWCIIKANEVCFLQADLWSFKCYIYIILKPVEVLHPDTYYLTDFSKLRHVSVPCTSCSWHAAFPACVSLFDTWLPINGYILTNSLAPNKTSSSKGLLKVQSCMMWVGITHVHSV